MALTPLSANRNNPTTGIVFILIAVIAISVNDMLIKRLSGEYPLHQMVLIRSAIGLIFSLTIVWFEGGFHLLWPRRPALHVLRGSMLVIANLAFFTALAALPLADATALFFAAPLFITLLSIPILGERVGRMRTMAVVVGFLGVLVMLKPWQSQMDRDVSYIVLLLPVVAAVTYALNQILTRMLGTDTKAGAMAVYVQTIFVIVSLGFFAVAGDGRFAAGSDNPAWVFLLREWVWPAGADMFLFLYLGVNATVIGYCLSQAYRMADAATVAPFEYVGLPLAVFWGWMIWGELPDATVSTGILMIIGSGLFVLFRARILARRQVRRGAENKSVRQS